MRLENGEIGLILLVAGIFVILYGFLCFVGALDHGYGFLLFVGILMIIIGAAVSHKEVKDSWDTFDRYQDLRMLSKVPDDDYMVDLNGDAIKEKMKKDALPEVTDLTAEGGTEGSASKARDAGPGTEGNR